MTAAAPLQRQMPLDDARICVLLTPSGVRAELRTFHYDEHEITSLIEAHELAPAFNIGLGGRREFRVMPSALKFYQQTGGSRRRRMMRAEILEELYRGVSAHPVLDGEVIRRWLNCSSDHLTRLVDEGFLTQAPGTRYRKGPDGSPKILRGSFEEFLFNSAKV
jgi:hypothetical protein